MSLRWARAPELYWVMMLVVATGCGRFHYISTPSDGSADVGTRDVGTSDMGVADTGTGDAALRDTGGPVDDAALRDTGPGDVGVTGPCAAARTSGTAFERTLIDLPANRWFEAPDTQMQTVCVPRSANISGVSGCRAVISAWSSGAYDSRRRRMVIWGGGNGDYWGNEVYAFDVPTSTWLRLTEPSLIPDGVAPEDFLNRDPLPDGQPVSRSTYDGTEYLPGRDIIWSVGGSRASDGIGTGVTWHFDPSTTTWSPHAIGPPNRYLAAAYDWSADRVWMSGVQSLRHYHVLTDTWVDEPGFRAPPLWPRYANAGSRTGAFDPSRRLFWTVGDETIMVWDVVRNIDATDAWPTLGAGTYSNRDYLAGRYDEQIFEGGGGLIYDVPAPGFDYDSASDAMVAWPNDGAPWILDLSTRAWTIGDATNAPTSTASGGTFGRWRYLAVYNVFILVTHISDNVHFYKHTAGCGGG